MLEAELQQHGLLIAMHSGALHVFSGSQQTGSTSSSSRGIAPLRAGSPFPGQAQATPGGPDYKDYAHYFAL